MRTSLVAAVAGGLAGIGIGLGVGTIAGVGDAGEILVAPTTTSGADATAPPVTYVSPDETVLGQAVLVPEGLEMDGDRAVFSYDLVTIAPLQGAEPGFVGLTAQDPGTPVDPLSLTPVFPTDWTLETAGGSFPGETATITSRSVRFDVPSSFSPSQVTGLRIDAYRVPVPINETFEMADDVPTFEVAPGVTLSLIQVVDQGNQTIVQIEILSAEAFNRENLTVEGVGPEWASAVREAEGRPRYNLRRVGEDLQNRFVLRVRGIVWLRVAGPVAVDIGSP